MRCLTGTDCGYEDSALYQLYRPMLVYDCQTYNSMLNVKGNFDIKKHTILSDSASVDIYIDREGRGFDEAFFNRHVVFNSLIFSPLIID